MKKRRHLLRKSRLRWPIFIGVSFSFIASLAFGLIEVLSLSMSDGNAVVLIGIR